MATIEREEIFKGSPADFEGIVSIHDSRLMMRHALKGAFCYAFDVAVSAIEPIKVHSSPIGYIGRPLPPQVMPNPGQWCKINIRPAKWWTRNDLNTGIVAQALPNQRSLLVLWCEDQDWPEIEPYWLELIAELRRLGCIESAEAELPAEPVDTEAGGRAGDGPSKPALKYRAEWVHKWHLARLSEKRLSAELFLMREDAKGFMHSAQMLRRYAKDPEVLAYIERELSSLTHDRV